MPNQILGEEQITNAKNFIISNKEKLINDFYDYGQFDYNYLDRQLDPLPRPIRILIIFFLWAITKEILKLDEVREFDKDQFKESARDIFYLYSIYFFETKELNRIFNYQTLMKKAL